MTIDERLAALTARHEALTMNVELMNRSHEAAMADNQAAIADIHATHEEIQSDIKILLRSQVAMTDSMDKMAKSIAELAEAQRHTDRRMDALILTVDEIVRGRNGGPKV